MILLVAAVLAASPPVDIPDQPPNDDSAGIRTATPDELAVRAAPREPRLADQSRLRVSDLAGESGLSEDDFVRVTVAELAGKPVPPTIWNPPK
jgi:hypothetical protein